ncbi:MAG: hypothetical protein GX811_00145 [Lentisphaerae bacterium]|nr:hypothetical protein [Lentisphaerota bacterium]
MASNEYKEIEAELDHYFNDGMDITVVLFFATTNSPLLQNFFPIPRMGIFEPLQP